MLLAGDIGGTKTILALYSAESGPHAPLAEATYPSVEYPSLETLASEFLARVNLKVERASFGVAGPVVGGRATVTNLPWVLDEAQLRAALDLSAVHLLNDVLAVAHAVPGLGSVDVRTLNQGAPADGGAIAVIAPGTGLGEAYLTWDGVRYRAFASEGGHTDFGPNTPLEMEMLRFLQQRFDHVSYERICSGIGLPNIYRFLKESGYASEPAWLAEQLAADDPTPIIVAAALDTSRPCELCAATLDLFVSALGAEAGNMALKVLATGGVYLGGGIPPRILPLLAGGEFMQAFLRKGRFSELLSRMPVRVILNSKAALLGAALYGLEAR
jgi:glucokinase